MRQPNTAFLGYSYTGGAINGHTEAVNASSGSSDAFRGLS